MSIQVETPPGGHPLAEFATRLRDRLDTLVDPAKSRPVWAMDAAEQRHVLTELAAAGAQLEALRLQVLAEADRSGATGAEASASAAEWVAVTTRQRRTHARSDLELALSLERHAPTAAGMATGAVNPDQARVIVRSIDRLPTSGDFAVDGDQRLAAETTWSRWLGTTTPRTSRSSAPGCSRWSHPTWPRPTKDGSSKPRKPSPPARPA